MKLAEKGIVIRKTVEEDLHQIYSEGKDEPSFSSLPFEFTPENLAEIFASQNSICFTAVRKKKVLGFIIGSVKDDESRIHWLMVKEKFRKAGIGEELIKSYIEISKNSGAENFLIAVFKNISETVKLFNNNGFSIKESFVEPDKKI